MHLEASVPMDTEKTETETSDDGIYKTAKIRSGAFRGSESGSVEEDKELEAIFERTFGKSAFGKSGGSDTEGKIWLERKNGQKNQKSRFMMWVAQSIQKT